MKRGGLRLLPLPSEEEVEAVETLLNLPKLFAKYELLSNLSYTWGNKKKRSDLPESSSHRKVTSSPVVNEADKSPSTPFCFLNSGSDGGDDNNKVVSVHEEQPLSLKKIIKKKDTDDLMMKYKRMLQDNETLKREINTVQNYHQQILTENLEWKAKRQEFWNSPIKVNLEQQQHYHHQKQQISMFALQQQQHEQHCQPQLMVDPNNVKLMPMSSSSNSNGGGGGGGRFGLFNQIEPRIKFHGQTYDFMSSSKPLDQSKYMVIDNDLKVKKAADARKRRIMKMKDNKNSLLNLKLSRGSR